MKPEVCQEIGPTLGRNLRILALFCEENRKPPEQNNRNWCSDMQAKQENPSIQSFILDGTTG
jgi:hypothetical protein